MSIIIMERGLAGFERGRNLDKIGLHAQDTAELFFSDVHVPAGTSWATRARASPCSWPTSPRSGSRSPSPASPRPGRHRLDARLREGAPGVRPVVGSFQNSRFVLAEAETEVTIGQAFIDQCVLALNEGRLTAEERPWPSGGRPSSKSAPSIDASSSTAATATWRVPHRQAYLDARVTTIYGGTTEIMKEIIGRSMGI